MKLNILIGLLIIAYLVWVTYEMDKEHKRRAKAQRELEVEWQLRRATLRRDG